MPKQTETIPLSEGDQTWLGSTRGIYTNRTETLVPSDFPADLREGGYIKSGTPVTVTITEDGDHETTPYVEGQILSGFIFTDQVVGTDLDEALNYPLMDFGRVRTERLPVEFTAPAPELNATTIVFI